MLYKRNFYLKAMIIIELSAVDIYAGVVTNLGLKKRSRDITEFLKNIKGTIDDDDWDQVILALPTYGLSVSDKKILKS